MHEVIGDYVRFVSQVEEGLADSSIDQNELAMMDHLCYRVETLERYAELKKVLGAREEFVGEAQISGRPISTFEFREPLRVNNWVIPYLELPAPEDGSPYPEGLEHAELVVIGGLCRFMSRHPELNFNTAGLSRKVNPELGLKTKYASVKFHEQPLGAVVRIESRLGI